PLPAASSSARPHSRHTGYRVPPTATAVVSGTPHTAQLVRRSESPLTRHPRRCDAWWPAARAPACRAATRSCAAAAHGLDQTVAALLLAPVFLPPAPVPKDRPGLLQAASNARFPRSPAGVPHSRSQSASAALRAVSRSPRCCAAALRHPLRLPAALP